jgi:CRISPR-associated endoribonuclease Cas6
MTLPDLTRVVAAGQWEGPPHPRPVGRALNSWLFGELAKLDATSAEALHDLSAVKPLTIALVERPARALVVTGYGPCAVPVAELAGRLPERLLLDGQWWRRDGSQAPEVTSSTWGEVGADLVAPGAPLRSRFEFRTPMSFHSKGQFLPLPLPELVLRSLLERWQRWSTVDLGGDAVGVIQASAILTRFRGETTSYQLTGFNTGFVGWAEIGLRRPPPEYSGLLAVLARFAPFAGVGQKVGMGMGCVETRLPMPDRSV